MLNALSTLLPLAAAVDIVIPAGCRADEALTDVSGAEDSGRSLTLTLESIKSFAPWARRIYVLQNPGCRELWQRRQRQEQVPEAHKRLAYDRIVK